MGPAPGWTEVLLPGSVVRTAMPVTRNHQKQCYRDGATPGVSISAVGGTAPDPGCEPWYVTQEGIAADNRMEACKKEYPFASPQGGNRINRSSFCR